MFESEIFAKFGLKKDINSKRVLFYSEEPCHEPSLICCIPGHNALQQYVDFEFDVALSTHYLFTHAVPQELDFHLNTIRELTRVAKELRIYPLVDTSGELSALVGPVLLSLQQEQYGAEIREVSSEGNPILRVWAQLCHLPND